MKKKDSKAITLSLIGVSMATPIFNIVNAINPTPVRLVIKEKAIVMQDEIIKGTENNDHNRVRRSSSIISMTHLYSKLKYSINMKSWTLTNSIWSFMQYKNDVDRYFAIL